jgi:hypothetical protein
VRGCQSRASATSRGNFTEHPQGRQITRLTAVHHEVRPSKARPARSPRRVRARRRGQIVFKMRFRIANPWINRYWVNCDQVSFWFQRQKGPPFKYVIRVSDRTHLQKLFISVNTPFYEGFSGKNARLRELRRRRDFGRFWAIMGNLGLFGAVSA